MAASNAGDVFADLRYALVLLDEAEFANEGLRSAVDRLGTAIDACLVVVDTPALPDTVADHNALVDEVNAAIDRYNPVSESLNAAGASCQICGLTICDGQSGVQTAVIPEAGIGLYSHTDCRDRLAAHSATPAGGV